MTLRTDRNGQLAVTFASGESVSSVTFEATRPLWQVRWYRRVTISLILLGLAALVAFGFWWEDYRSGLLIRLTEENRFQRQMLQCYKQAPLIQMSWVAREAWVKGCVEK